MEQWEKAALKYSIEQEKSKYADNNKSIVKKRFERLAGEKVLDMGCGYGYYTEYFQSIGGNVIGVDGSSTMIQIAKEKYPEIDCRVCDITEALPFSNDVFDIVFCNQVLMDINNIDTVFEECYRIMKKNGIFYFSIVHPAFYTGIWKEDAQNFQYAKEISFYLTERELENHFWGETKHFHRPISYYLNKVAEAGFTISHIEEPRTYDGKVQNDDLPLFLMVECRK